MSHEGNEQVIYLDNAATSFPKPESVYAAMDSFARQIGGSGGRSSHRKSIESAELLDGVREDLARLLGAGAPEWVCFGLNATEALNLAIYGLAEPGGSIVTTMLEHNSVRRPLADLRERYGCKIITVPADERGLCDSGEVIGALRDDTQFVVMVWASNVMGSLQEIEPVARACRSRKIPFIVDAAQICGAYPVNFQELGLSVLAFTGHKSLLGPQGTGGLVVHPDVAPRIQPFKRGGTGTVSESDRQPGFLPDRFEAGTLNGHGLAGLKAGVEFLLARGVESVRAQEMALWRRFRDGLRAIPHVRVYGPEEADRAVGIISITVDGMEPTDVGFLLDVRFGVLTRTGLHCAPGAHQTIGTMPFGTVRFSLGFSTTEAEVDAALEAVARIRERN